MATHHLYIDLETYSGVDLTKSGLYKYAQSPDFGILLLGWSLDGEPVEVVDLTEEGGAARPLPLAQALFDPDTVKHAHNAAFEWYCLSRWFGAKLPLTPEEWLPQWRCTMLHCLYCGYPGSLAAAGAALGLSEEQQKLSAGKAPIAYFCKPCSPTKSNGERTRNLPRHAPEKWELFVEYNRRDVETEIEIDRRLRRFPVPDEVQAQWVTDQIINLRGVAVDAGLVAGAQALDEGGQERHLAEARESTGRDNPTSRAQLLPWLQARAGVDVPDLRKDTVTELLAGDGLSPEVRRVLELRQELSKTSTAKYDALETVTCADGRVRGLLQFYGANRTGRWSGRLVQPQNLPRTYISPDLLPLARTLVRERQEDALRLIFGSVPDTLSQLIRTAFIPGEGAVFVDADFSAIEARLLAWLAGEDWVLQVFRTTGKIYEATAAQMFGIPVERIVKGNPEYSYRQRGKVATLALGYQGSTGSLISMGALKMGLDEEELPDIVERWRQANPAICRAWRGVEGAAWHVLKTGRPVGIRDGGSVFARECDPENGLDYLTIQLPSRRKLYYAQPHAGTNRFGNPAICYYGLNQTSHRWEETETYGGKLVENITQAIGRDCLAEAITRLERAGYRVVFHIHDEVILEVPGGSEIDLQTVIEIMSQPPIWAPGLPLDADGWVGSYFRKD